MWSVSSNAVLNYTFTSVSIYQRMEILSIPGLVFFLSNSTKGLFGIKDDNGSNDLIPGEP